MLKAFSLAFCQQYFIEDFASRNAAGCAPAIEVGPVCAAAISRIGIVDHLAISAYIDQSSFAPGNIGSGTLKPPPLHVMVVSHHCNTCDGVGNR